MFFGGILHPFSLVSSFQIPLNAILTDLCHEYVVSKCCLCSSESEQVSELLKEVTPLLRSPLLLQAFRNWLPGTTPAPRCVQWASNIHIYIYIYLRQGLEDA